MESLIGRSTRLLLSAVSATLLLSACGASGDASIGSDPDPRREPARVKSGARAPKSAAEKGKAPQASDKPTGKQKPTAISPVGPLVLVSRVVDGDTIEVALKGRAVDVRLIGIDTPETVHPSRPVECYGPAASAFTERSLEGRRVRLEFDVERTDRYGRTLAYVWLDGSLFNRTLVAAGFAQVSTYPPNVKYVERFVGAQRGARAKGSGLWSGCESERAAASSGGGRAAASSSKKCDPSYKGACVPPYPPDLDCSEVGATEFTSTGSDPHGFEGDGDGVACES